MEDKLNVLAPEVVKVEEIDKNNLYWPLKEDLVTLLDTVLEE